MIVGSTTRLELTTPLGETVPMVRQAGLVVASTSWVNVKVPLPQRVKPAPRVAEPSE